jgi:hypothetical protein
MGMDPIDDTETYEVVIQLEGPVNRADFTKFREQLKLFLDKVTGDGTTTNPGIPNTHPNHKPAKPKLQARESRAGQRKNV